jgi:hypothetical protein
MRFARGMRSTSALRPIFVPSIVLAACAPTMRPPATNGGPALSETRIQVSVVRQGCAQVQEPDEHGWDLVDERVEIEVRNASGEPVTVHRDRFHLLAPDGSALTTATWNAAAPVTVAGGDSGRFELRFMTHGALECTKEMRLDSDAAVTLRAAPVAFRPVSFVPNRGL